MKIVKHIPNTITSMNLLCGVLGVIAAFSGRLDVAFYLMLAASVFDFCDGLAARALGAYSDLGKELDSLSDLVSFGVLPSLMMYNVMGGYDPECTKSLLSLVPLVVALLSGLRLAKFNVDSRQTDNFIGLPTPACALCCGALVHYIYSVPEGVIAGLAAKGALVPSFAVVLAILLVVELPMFSLKFKKGQKGTMINKLRIGFIGACIAVAILVLLLGLKFSMIFVVVIPIYVLINLVNFLATPRK